MPNVNTWHHRGGLSDAQIVYEPDGQGGVRAVVLGQDAYGNDQILPADAPWWGNLLQQGIYATTDAIASSGGGRNRFPTTPAASGAAVSASVSPSGAGVGLGLSSNTLLLLGVVAAVFLLGKGKR